MYRLYEYASSGNCYKIRLTLSYLELPYERISIDIIKGESRIPDFLKINPNGRVPVLETEDGNFLPESNAAIWFLASDTGLLPATSLQQAQVLQCSRQD